MKTTKKIMASALALTMAASAGVAALADSEPIKTSGGSATVPVTITSAKKQKIDPDTNKPMVDTNGNPVYEENEYDAPVFSVTVPASLPLTINADGTVTTPDNLEIKNKSAGSVKVTNVEFSDGGTWKFEPYTSNFDEMQVNAHKLGLSLKANGKEVKTGDTGDDLKPDWTIAKGASLGITAAAKASAVSKTVTENNAASVIFTVGWNAAAATTGGDNNENKTDDNNNDGEQQVETITFSVMGNKYTAAKGMTWEAFISSAYNTGAFSMSGNTVFYGADANLHVNASDTIRAEEYVADSTGGGNGND